MPVEFIDGNGKKHTMRVRNLGHLEAIQERHGVAIDRVFMSDVEGVSDLLYGDLRRLGGILADMCGLNDDEAKTMIKSLDREALIRGRSALVEALADFCLPPGQGAEFLKQLDPVIRGTSSQDGSSKATSLAESSASTPGASLSGN